MKKVFFAALTVLMSLGTLQAQNLNSEELLRSQREFLHQRDASRKHFQKSYPMVDSPKAVKTPQGLPMPEKNWFPGEWEEVQAIVVTCYYNYLVPGHEGQQTWMADPIVSGWADYYQYSGGWQSAGSGPYVASIDTTSTFGNTFFYLMDAIQMGGAQAWVRIENASDSNVVYRKLQRMGLRDQNIRFIIGTGNSFWYRDCGPICFYYGDDDSVAMADFMYYPGRALDDSLPSLIHNQMGIPNYITSIEWEGGNCLVDGAGMVLSSDAIYSNNTDTYGQYTWDGVNPSSIHMVNKTRLTKQQVYDSLQHILGPRATYIIPTFKYDGGTGHIDLYCDMWDENGFVFSKFPEHYSNWTDYKTAAKNIDSLTHYKNVFNQNYKHAYIPFPCTNAGGYFTSQSSYNNNYTRTYSNHTFVNNVLLQPVFSAVVDGEPTSQWDKERFDSLKLAYPGYTMYPIDVREFDGSGGAIHCITKQIPAENPIRILHPSITGNTENLYYNTNAPIEATITNKSGIESAKCYYRINGGNWNEVSLTEGSDNLFTGSIATSTATVSENGTKVEYYISATSNNGKTITKPMTANQGGYYTFYLGHNSELGITAATLEGFGPFYPNPAAEMAMINIDFGAGETFAVDVFNMMGQQLHHSSVSAEGKTTFTLPTSQFTTGLYTVVFTAKDGRKVARKLIVK